MEFGCKELISLTPSEFIKEKNYQPLDTITRANSFMNTKKSKGFL